MSSTVYVFGCSFLTTKIRVNDFHKATARIYKNCPYSAALYQKVRQLRYCSQLVKWSRKWCRYILDTYVRLAKPRKYSYLLYVPTVAVAAYLHIRQVVMTCWFRMFPETSTEDGNFFTMRYPRTGRWGVQRIRLDATRPARRRRHSTNELPTPDSRFSSYVACSIR